MTSIRARLTVFLFLSAVFTAIIIGLATYRNTLKQNEELFDYQLRQIALSLRDQGSIQPDLPSIVEADSFDFVVQIWTASGRMIYSSDPRNPLPDSATLGFADVVSGDRRWRAYGLLARDRVIQVAQPLELRRGLAASAALRSLAPLLAFAPLMALLIWWLVGQSLSSVKRLANDVARRDARGLEPVSQQDIPTEIAPLVSALNALLLRLKQAFASQRAFVADAAHELRSPLTALSLQLQLLSKAQDEVARRGALEQLNLGVDRAARLIEQLLTAARAEHSDVSVPFSSIDLAELTRQAIAAVFALAQARRVAIDLDAHARCFVNGDAAALMILIRNLLDNAVRYTPEGGAVHASIALAASSATLVVEDSGPGIPESDRQRVFARFYRREVSDQTGSGLGLSIVQTIADRHGAIIELGSSEMGGLKVKITFPLDR
ncbi:MAG: sensor histidine kinase N-terminal domain-containing protein [Herminiimonas sp.]|nr:sensor histidine kinase N-terminal domain-containing protein [Herminiimonas sp.]